MPAAAAPPLPKQVTAGQLAKLLDVTERAIQGRTADGRLPKTDEGRVDLRAIVDAGVAALASRGTQEGGGLDFEKARLAREQAESWARKNAKERGELVEVGPIRDAMISMIEVVKAHLFRIPKRMFPTDPAQRQRATDIITEVLNELSAERAIEERPARVSKRR